MFSMKTVLLLALFLYAAAAAPAEDKPEAPEAVAVVDPPEEQMPVPAQEEEKAPETKFKQCLPPWEQIGSRCYMVVKHPNSWNNAKYYCSNQGGHLASVTTEEEEEGLQYLIGQTEAWLGARYQQGNWMWIDGQGIVCSKHLDDLDESNSKHCLYQTNSGWGSAECYGISKFFVCSKNL